MSNTISATNQINFGGNDTGTSNNLTLNGAITFTGTGTATITVDSPTVIGTIGYSISGITATTGSLTKAGPGTLVLAGSSAQAISGAVAFNTFNAPVNVTGDTLSVNLISTVNATGVSGAALGTALGSPTTTANGTITLSGGALRYTGAGTRRIE